VSQENVDIVRRAYAALNESDWDGMFRDAHPEFEVTTQRGPNAGTNRGRAKVQGFLDDYKAAFESVVWEPDAVFEREDHVVVLVVTRGRPRGAAVDIVTRNGHLWTVRDGRLLSVKTFPDPDKALEAAGLRG
jgi:ketosteroid isomerase-like protein